MYEIRCKAGSSQLYVRCVKHLCSFMARFCKDEHGLYKYSIMSILYHYTECHEKVNMKAEDTQLRQIKRTKVCNPRILEYLKDSATLKNKTFNSRSDIYTIVEKMNELANLNPMTGLSQE